MKRHEARRYKVIVWATGGVGRYAIRTIADRPNLELAGVWVHSPAKDGRDAGELAGMAKLGVGATRDVELIADAPGDWPLHCHMTHHIMNQMGHDIPNMIGVDPRGLDAKASPLLPGYMTMGQDGMADMGEMGMKVPDNSIPMVGAKGPFGYITMGGMFTLLKVRENLTDTSKDPGNYQHPAGTVADEATAQELQRDGITVPSRKP